MVDVIEYYFVNVDLVVGVVFILGVVVFKLLNCEYIKNMKLGFVLVDVVIDQGGCFEIFKVIIYQDFVYIIDDVVYYCVVNMFGGVVRILIMVLNNVILLFGFVLVNKGFK